MIRFLQKTANLIFYTLTFFFVVMIATALTGGTKRKYQVLTPKNLIKIGGKQFSIEELVSTYLPKMYLRETTPSPKLLWVWYEAINNPSLGTVDLVYYYVWENEINPNPTIHKLYSIFRAAYYGYPLYDIEYIQISVSQNTGEISRIRFETSESNNYFQMFPEHLTAYYTLNPDQSYKMRLVAPNGDTRKQKDTTQTVFDDHHVLFGVQTWNHLSHLLDQNHTDEYNLISNTTLKYLHDQDYQKYKFVRKSQGDHQSKESILTIPIASLAVLLFVKLPVLIIHLFSKK